MDVTTIILFCLRFILTPILLIVIMSWAYRLSDVNSARRTAAFYLGIAIALLIITINLLTSHQYVFFQDINSTFALESGTITTLVIIGIIAGFAAGAISNLLLNSEIAAAVIVVVTTSAAIVAIYAMIVSSQSRDQILLLSLSAIIGSVGYFVLAPHKK